MIAHLKKAGKIVFTLRFSILFIFISLFVIAIASLITITYFDFSKSMTYVSQQLIQEISSSTFKDINNEFDHIKVETELVAELITHHLVNINNVGETSQLISIIFNHETKTLASVQSVFFGDEQGNVILYGKESDNAMVTQIFKSNTGLATRVTSFKNQEGKITQKTEMKKLEYDPRTRPWYQTAKTNKKAIITDVYRYQFLGYPYWGITIASPAISQEGTLLGVIGVNVRLDFLRKSIEKINVSQHGVIFIIADDGRLIAFPHMVQYRNPVLKNIEELGHPGIMKSFEVYQTKGQEQFQFEFEGYQYLSTYKAMPGFGGHTWYLGIIVPEHDFTGALRRSNFVTMMIGILVLIVGIILVSKLITRIVKPIKDLIEETDKIRNFELSEDIVTESRMREIIYLADSLHNMKKGLRLFQQYVPKDLVRQLIETGTEAQIGGAKKQLAIMFTDIKDFTTIAGLLDPNQLMIYTCEYFDELSRIITEEKGTIDKYIGDSLMVFWGAPLPQENPSYCAARAALRCQKRLRELHKNWVSRGIPPFFTRIGIHMGSVIVGNLGSSQRLNYTALGDAVNIASRLEGTCKIYNANIIVSETVYSDIKNQFMLRFIDCVALKGKEQGIRIYELLAEQHEKIGFDIDAYNKMFAAGFAEYAKHRWDEAIANFHHCIEIYPTDTIAPLFIGRCEYFKVQPPQAGWNGVWVY